MPLLSNQIQQIQPSPTLALNEKANQLRQEGKSVIHFGIGEPKNDLPPGAQEAVVQKLNTGQVKYGASAGTAGLINGVIDYTKIYYGKQPEPENVMITVGAKQALFNLMYSLLNAGDEALLLAPYWVSYPEMIRLARAQPRIVYPQDNLLPSMDAIRQAVSPRTRLMILNNPNNPGGILYPEELIAKLVDYCETNQIFLIMDDIYHQLIAPDQTWIPGYIFTSRDINQSHLIIVNGISKSYGMTGFRIGWCVGPDYLIQAMTRMQGHTTSGASVLLQAAAEGALRADQESIQDLNQFITGNRNLLLSELNTLPGLITPNPGGTFYCFPDFSAYLADSAQLAALILEKAYVATVPGSAFGMEGHLRLSYAGPREQIAEGVRRIRWAIDPDAPRSIEIAGETHTCSWERKRK